MSTGPEGNGLTDIDAVTARTNTYSPGDQVASADLNAIQDDLITVSGAVDYALGQVAPCRSSTSNESAIGGPDLFGGITVWVEAETNGVTEVVVDDGVDWRDRYIHAVGWADLAANIDFPGEAGDDDEEADRNDTTPPKMWMDAMWYSQQGTAAAPPAAGGRVNIAGGPTETFVVYVNTSGELCVRMSPWSAAQARCILKVTASPRQNHY